MSEAWAIGLMTGTVLDGTFNRWMGSETGSDSAAVARAKAGNASYLALIKRLYDADNNHPVEVTGRRLRKMMTWLNAKEPPKN